jgi:hypothetical protein
LWNITHDPQIVVRLLIENLLPQPTGLMAVDLLREIRPGAASAIPALQKIAHSESRFDRNGAQSDEMYPRCRSRRSTPSVVKSDSEIDVWQGYAGTLPPSELLY